MTSSWVVVFLHISDHNHGVYKGVTQCQPSEPPIYRQLGGGGPVVIGDNVWVGDNVVILRARDYRQRGSSCREFCGSRRCPGRLDCGRYSDPRILKQFQAASGTWKKP